MTPKSVSQKNGVGGIPGDSANPSPNCKKQNKTQFSVTKNTVVGISRDSSTQSSTQQDSDQRTRHLHQRMTMISSSRTDHHWSVHQRQYSEEKKLLREPRKNLTYTQTYNLSLAPLNPVTGVSNGMAGVADLILQRDRSLRTACRGVTLCRGVLLCGRSAETYFPAGINQSLAASLKALPVQWSVHCLGDTNTCGNRFGTSSSAKCKIFVRSPKVVKN